MTDWCCDGSHAAGIPFERSDSQIEALRDGGLVLLVSILSYA